MRFRRIMSLCKVGTLRYACFIGLIILFVIFSVIVKYNNRTTSANLQQIFTQIYRTNEWGSNESVSGPGSTLEQTNVIRRVIPKLCKHFGIKSITDAPCGDFNWLQKCDIDDVTYIGIDIVKDIIEKNNTRFGNIKRTFQLIDVTKEPIPRADLILCRDLLVHLSFDDIYKTLKNFKDSNSKYLLVTTYVNEKRINSDIVSGQWRPLNLHNAPFNFPQPILFILEKSTEHNGIYSDKCLCLWELSNIQIDQLKTASIKI